MNRQGYKMLLLAMTTFFVLAGCKQKRDTGDIVVPKVEKPRPGKPVSMQPYNVVTDVNWLGKSYQVVINRAPDDSLQMVKDETGQRYVDNRISVGILRQDGTVFFRQSFTKNAFMSLLNDDYQLTGILEGIVFDKVEGAQLVLAGSVSHPQTDEYIPFVITISSQGDVGIKRDEIIDTYSESNPDTNIEEETL